MAENDKVNDVDPGTETTNQIDNIAAATLLASHRMPLPATFSFNFLNMPFDVGIRRMPEGGAELVVHGHLGSIPFSAESVAARKMTLALVDAGQNLPMANINVDRNQNIVVRSLMTFQGNPSPATVAAAAAAIAIAVKPVCELINKSHAL